MKKINQLCFNSIRFGLIALFVLWSGVSVLKASNNKSFQSLKVLAPQDNPLAFYVENVANQKLLRVSFNANEGTDGTLYIYDSNNQVVNESSFELIKSPFYATVDVTSIAAGTYTLKLITATGTHTGTLTLN